MGSRADKIRCCRGMSLYPFQLRNHPCLFRKILQNNALRNAQYRKLIWNGYSGYNGGRCHSSDSTYRNFQLPGIMRL